MTRKQDTAVPPNSVGTIPSGQTGVEAGVSRVVEDDIAVSEAQESYDGFGTDKEAGTSGATPSGAKTQPFVDSTTRRARLTATASALLEKTELPTPKTMPQYVMKIPPRYDDTSGDPVTDPEKHVATQEMRDDSSAGIDYVGHGNSRRFKSTSHKAIREQTDTIEYRYIQQALTRPVSLETKVLHAKASMPSARQNLDRVANHSSPSSTLQTTTSSTPLLLRTEYVRPVPQANNDWKSREDRLNGKRRWPHYQYDLSDVEFATWQDPYRNTP